jgi:hypothetical protein
MSELTWVLLPGALIDGQTNSFATASYQRLVTIVTINANTAPTDPTGATFQLSNDGTLAAQVYTLAQGLNTVRVVVIGGGLTVAALKVLTVVNVLAGGVQDVNFWIESTVSGTNTDAWVVPTAADVQTGISAPEYSAFTAALMTTGQVDPIPGIMADSVAEIRDAIRSGRRNNLGPIGTIPSGAMRVFKAICKWHLFDRVKALPMYADKSAEPKKEAEEYLTKVRAGEIEFVAPTTIIEAVPSGVWGSETYVKVDPYEVLTGSDTP